MAEPQRWLYVGPYEEMSEKNRSKARLEKQAVVIVHLFLSLAVKKWWWRKSAISGNAGIELNIRDILLDHLGMFYLFTKGKRYTIFLRGDV